MKSGDTVGVDGKGISGRGQDVSLSFRHCDITSIQYI